LDKAVASLPRTGTIDNMITSKKKIILASQSAQRRLLMETLGVDFEVMPADIDEKAITHKSAEMRAQLVAQAKAVKIEAEFKKQYPNQDAVIIAADTFGYLNGKQFEKPATKEEAAVMLKELTLESSVTITGFCVIDTKSKTNEITAVTNTLKFRPLSEKEIQHYVQNNDVTSWSGGFSPAYHNGAALIDSIEGSLTSFTHGLPMELVIPALQKAGIIL